MARKVGWKTFHFPPEVVALIEAEQQAMHAETQVALKLGMVARHLVEFAAAAKSQQRDCCVSSGVN